MISRWKWYLAALLRKLWVRATVFALLGVVAALIAGVVQRDLPAGLGAGLGAGAVDSILQILASSMLAVTTFSLGIMVSALGSAAGGATPRATALLLQDVTTHNVLATFLGAFLFSLVGIIALKAGIYGDGGRLILFIATLLVVAVIMLTMLRWIAHLGDFGRLNDTLDRVETAAAKAMHARLDAPYLGGHPRRGPVPAEAWPVRTQKVGYVRHLDSAALSDAAEEAVVQVYLDALPGTFVDPSRPLAWVVGPEGSAAEIADAFTIGPMREFDQDPRFGLSVLAEIASRALSPAVNDPGTAIDVIGRAVRLLAPWARRETAELRYPRLWVPELRVAEMMTDVFRPIARDGASMVEVQIRLQKALITLARLDPGDFAVAARAQSVEALERAEAALGIEADRALVRALHDSLDTPDLAHRPRGI